MLPLRDCKTANDWNGGRGYWSEASAEPTSPHYLAVKRSLTASGHADRYGYPRRGKMGIIQGPSLPIPLQCPAGLARVQGIHDWTQT